jgi:serine protease Do
VTFEDGQSRRATLVGTDSKTGLAVVHVDAPGVEPVRMADEPLTVGERVTLVTGPTEGSSSGRMYLGQVSTVDDEVHTTAGVLDGMVEIDREVLPDHDGCAVADPAGRLVGVSLTGDPSDGRGGVVPADVVADVMQHLVRGDDEPHAWLGIEGVDLTGDETTLLGVDGGARLTKVVAGSPAARAHLDTGDVVIRIGGRTIRSTADVVDDLGALHPQQQVTIVVLRDGKPVELSATLGTKPTD